LITTSSLIPHEYPHRSCPCCSLDIHYSELEVLGGRVVSYSSPKTDRGCLTATGAHLWHWGQDWHELLFLRVHERAGRSPCELSRVRQQQRRKAIQKSRTDVTRGFKKCLQEKKKQHHDRTCWHLASVLPLHNQESVHTLMTAWYDLLSSETKELKPVPSLSYRGPRGTIC